MNEQYINYLKTLDIPEGYNYIVTASNGNIIVFLCRPYLLKDGGYFVNGSFPAEKEQYQYIGKLPSDIAIDDAVLEVSEIKANESSSWILGFNDYGQLG